VSIADVEETEPLSPEARSALKVIFITLFLDLIGFSIIFPLFPAMLDYYVAREGDGGGLVGSLVSFLENFSRAAGGPADIGIIVLFGGVLASLYSLLQFVFSPVLGSLSDRYGRKPVLLVSIAGIALSYVMWFFAGPFIVLVLARTLGGMMAGNISTASAVVADVTSVRNRPRGMAVIGIAFGIGFIVGPAIGGFSALIDLTELLPGLEPYGLNPFSLPAAIAFALSLVNLFWVSTRFVETLPPSGESDRAARSINPLVLFRTYEYPGVTKTNVTNFLFLTAFAGTEFGLTFLAADRLGYGPHENAYLFLFIGLTLALVQGGYVRRRAPLIGPKRMSLHGFACVIPGVVLLAFANSSLLMYVALFFMAVGAAQIIPNLTSLASAYAPAHDQGRILGVFRSLGALARGVGPLIACLLYWRLGAAAAYTALGIAMFAPFALTTALPDPGVRARSAARGKT